MCLVSDNITFCTCNPTDYQMLQHYWILHRFNKKKDLLAMGMPILPTSMRDPNFNLNNATLLQRLNEPDAFDKPLGFKFKDKLEIVFNNKTNDYLKTLTFTFIFKKGKWQIAEEDPFDLLNRYDEALSGKIKSALQRK